jgi:YD repeat-containing protein
VTGKVSVYTYDTGNRLTQATNAAGHTYDYGYDTDGNRTSVKTDGTKPRAIRTTPRIKSPAAGKRTTARATRPQRPAMVGGR